MSLLDHDEIAKLLYRHSMGDWGDMSDDDRQLNDDALITGLSRLFSAYNTTKGKIWVITEYDYSATTVLLPEEY